MQVSEQLHNPTTFSGKQPQVPIKEET